MAHLNDQIDTR